MVTSSTERATSDNSDRHVTSGNKMVLNSQCEEWNQRLGRKRNLTLEKWLFSLSKFLLSVPGWL